MRSVSGHWRKVTTRLSGVLLFCLSLAAARAAAADRAADPRALLEKLNQVSLDTAQIYALRNAQISRDRIKIHFETREPGSI